MKGVGEEGLLVFHVIFIAIVIRKKGIVLFDYPAYSGLFPPNPCHLDAIKLSKSGHGLYNNNK